MTEHVHPRGVTVRRAEHEQRGSAVSTGRSGPHRRRRRRDGGYVLIITALMLLPLLAFTGFAVDLGVWAGTASQVQAAADASALAGVVYLPDLSAKAISVAKDTARKNGYQDGVNGVTVTVTPNSRNELDVAIYDPNVGQYFSTAFTDAPDITRAGHSGVHPPGGDGQSVGPARAGPGAELLPQVRAQHRRATRHARRTATSGRPVTAPTATRAAPPGRTPTTRRTGTSTRSRSAPDRSQVSLSRSRSTTRRTPTTVTTAARTTFPRLRSTRCTRTTPATPTGTPATRQAGRPGARATRTWRATTW